ncbi:MAG: hypothetical protein GY795_24475 [Desulfobacterales bacterium]|nr:hypothetical protein [Desulfobacterales bacterium]
MLRQFEETEMVERLITLWRFILAVLKNIASEYFEINFEINMDCSDLLSDISHEPENKIHAVVCIKWLKKILTLTRNLCDKLILHIFHMPLLLQDVREAHTFCFGINRG